MAPEDARLSRMEADISATKSDIAAIRAMLGERCTTRGDELADLEKRMCVLEDDLARRKGGMAVLAAMCALSSALGGLLVKLWPLSGRMQ